MRKRLEMSPEKLKAHKAEINRRALNKRAERQKRDAYRKFVVLLLDTIEDLGWEKTELVLGSDVKMVEAIVDRMMQDDRFGVTISSGKLKYTPPVKEVEVILPEGER